MLRDGQDLYIVSYTCGPVVTVHGRRQAEPGHDLPREDFGYFRLCSVQSACALSPGDVWAPARLPVCVHVQISGRRCCPPPPDSWRGRGTGRALCPRRSCTAADGWLLAGAGELLGGGGPCCRFPQVGEPVVFLDWTPSCC